MDILLQRSDRTDFFRKDFGIVDLVSLYLDTQLGNFHKSISPDQVASDTVIECIQEY